MNISTIFIKATVVTGIVLLSACADTAREKKIDEKVSEEKTVQKSADLTNEAHDLFDHAPGLTEAQRAQLNKIRADMTRERDTLQTESLKLRSVLIKDIVSSSEHVEEIKLIKGRLRDIEDKRLDILFDAIDHANLALGKFAAEHQKELEETLREDRIGRSD